MAIGIRIISDNLSGDTAVVTFYPTSGGTIDLGTQTTPFNYLNPNFYGRYELYIPLYDYTYILYVNESIITGETYSYLARMATNNFWGNGILNYIDFSSEIIETTTDFTGWEINSIEPLTNQGYLYDYYNTTVTPYRWAVFVDTEGNEMESYQIDTSLSGYSVGNLSGKIVYFNDLTNKLIKYSNGQNVFTVTADTTNESLTVDTTTPISNGYFTLISSNISGDTDTNNIVIATELTPLDTWTASTHAVETYTNIDADFVAQFMYLTDDNSGVSFKIFNGTDGTLLQEIDLTSGDTYDEKVINIYGTNKIFGLLWNSTDSSVDYLIFQYDGNTDVLNIITHPFVDYESNSSAWITNLAPSPGGSESFVITLYDGAATTTDLGYAVSYCDLIYMSSGDTTINTYVFQDSGTDDKQIGDTFNVSNIANIACNTGDTYVSTLVINSTGVEITPSATELWADEGAVNIYPVGDGFVNLIFDNNLTGCTLVYVNSVGAITDTITGIEFTSASNFVVSNVGKVFQFSNKDGDDYYIIPSSDVFEVGNTLTMTDTVVSSYPAAQFKPDYLEPSIILNYDPDTNEANILSSTGYTSTFTFDTPDASGAQIQVGSDKLMYTYIDGDGFITIQLFDFDFNLLNSITTTHSPDDLNSTDSLACGNRFTVSTRLGVPVGDNIFDYVYLISESTITQSVFGGVAAYSTSYTMNDYVWITLT
jgi:hypothetical protein